MNISGKVFVVTGAASGIGKEITLELLAKGAKVAAVDLKKESLAELSKELGENSKNISTHALSVADKKAVEALPSEVITKLGQVDGVINNAGIIQPFEKINDLDYEAIDRVMGVNFYGTLYMLKAFLPDLLKRPAAHIVDISSMGGFLPVPGQGVYGASKAAVKLLTEALQVELLDTGVGVTVVFPGATSTNITMNSGVKSPISEQDAKAANIPTQSPKEVAGLVIKAIEINQPRVFAGKDSKFMNRLYRLSPGYATGLIAKQMKSLLP